MYGQRRIEQYHRRCEDWVCTKKENGEIWRELEEKVKNSVEKVKKRIAPCRREWQ